MADSVAPEAGGVGRDALRLKGEEYSDVPAGEAQDEPAVVEGAVVGLVVAMIALIHVDVVDAVEPIGVAELRVDVLVQVPGELGAEREDLSARRRALVEVEREQVLEVVGAGGARWRQHPPQRQVEQRRFGEVERVAGVGRLGGESGSQRGEAVQDRVCGEWVDHPEDDVGLVFGLDVDGDAPRLPSLVEDPHMQVGCRHVVFALVPVDTSTEGSVEDRHYFHPSSGISRHQAWFGAISRSMSTFSVLDIPAGSGFRPRRARSLSSASRHCAAAVRSFTFRESSRNFLSSP